MRSGPPARLTSREGRTFGFTVGGAFAVIAIVAGLRHHPLPATVTGALALALFVWAVAVPTRLGPVSRAWMRLAHGLSRVTTPIFMGLVFFVVITPIGLLMRAIGRNPIRHRLDGQSYFAPRDAARGDMTNQF